MTTKTSKKTTDLRSHFGLRTTPFTRELDIKDRWHSEIFREPLEGLRSVLDARGSAALVAPAGTGKTALLRLLAGQLPEARYRVSYVKVTAIGKRELCREIAAAVGATPAGSYPMLVRRLQERFEGSLRQDGRCPVLLVDEAHDMRPEVLGIFRVLTNFEMDSRLVLGLVLCGQPRLLTMLAREEAEAIAQRLALVATLRRLSPAETLDYVRHRMSIAGARTEAFDSDALTALCDVTNGNLRAIDSVAWMALHMAARRNVPVIDPALVAEARKRVMP